MTDPGGAKARYLRATRAALEGPLFHSRASSRPILKESNRPSVQNNCQNMRMIVETEHSRSTKNCGMQHRGRAALPAPRPVLQKFTGLQPQWTSFASAETRVCERICMNGSESAGTIGELERGKMTSSRTETRDSQPVVFEITKTINIVAAGPGKQLTRRNRYRCPYDRANWTDEWSCACNDRCPTCRAEFEPYFTEDMV